MSPERMSAADRKESILAAAVTEIAAHGFRGATTADIARRAGISQPYVFRFFPTKKELYVAVIDRCISRILRDWEGAVPAPGESRLEALGRTYGESLAGRRAELHVHLSAYAAADDPDVAEGMRTHLARIFRYVVEQAAGDGHEDPHRAAGEFMGRGFLINAAMAIGLESALTQEEWAGICATPKVARIEDRSDAAS